MVIFGAIIVSFIENRIIQDEFIMEDINKNAYYMRDILRSYISCEMKTSEKKRKLSSGECSTITMMVLCSELNSRHEVGRLLYLAYLHDLDPIFSDVFHLGLFQNCVEEELTL